MRYYASPGFALCCYTRGRRRRALLRDGRWCIRRAVPAVAESRQQPGAGCAGTGTLPAQKHGAGGSLPAQKLGAGGNHACEETQGCRGLYLRRNMGLGDPTCTKTQGWEPPGHAGPCSCKPLMIPQCFSSIFRRIPVYTPVSSCAFTPIYSCATTLKGSSAPPHPDAGTGRHTASLLFPWAPLPRRAAPSLVLPSSPL